MNHTRNSAYFLLMLLFFLLLLLLFFKALCVFCLFICCCCSIRVHINYTYPSLAKYIFIWCSRKITSSQIVAIQSNENDSLMNFSCNGGGMAMDDVRNKWGIAYICIENNFRHIRIRKFKFLAGGVSHLLFCLVSSRFCHRFLCFFFLWHPLDLLLRNFFLFT